MVERKMSLVAMFDDMCRYNVHLTEGIEDHFIKFATSVDECRTRVIAAEVEVHRLQLLLKNAETEKLALEANLIHARNAIEMEMKRRAAAERERDSLERQIMLIRELLMSDHNAINNETREKLAFLNSMSQSQQLQAASPRRLTTIDESSGSLLSSSDVSYDKTDENMEEGFIRKRLPEKRSTDGKASDGRRRPSAPPLKDITPPKRNKHDDTVDSLVATTTVEIPVDGVVTATSVIETKPRNRSSAEPVSVTATLDNRFPIKADADVGFGVRSTLDTPMKTSSNWLPKQYSTANLNSRAHDFCNKTIIKPETCTPCGKRIKFGKPALKCKDCKAICHPDCKEQVPLPCVPTVHTPLRGFIGTIADFTPLTFPMVPAIVIHCMNEVEARGLNELGIYRVPGSERDVKDLKEKFLRGKGVPNLSKIDIHVVCGCVKDFLRSLREPLIINSLWKVFVNATEMNDKDDCLMALYQAISELPRPNRDTLAFVILHLQRVAESPDCKMPASNLAKIMGPTIVGYSSVDPEPALMISETKKQFAVMDKLLSMSSEYWRNFINVDVSKFASYTPDTQERNQNRRISGSRSSLGYMTLTPLKPRENASKSTGKSKRTHNFFSSPMLK